MANSAKILRFMKKILLLLLIAVPGFAFSQVSPVYFQSNYVRVVQPEFDDSTDLANKLNDIVSYHNPKAKFDTLINPYTGGLNNATFFNIDFNGDGIGDLYVYDRELGENQFMLFEGTSNKSTIYRYAPQYHYGFPDSVTKWVEMADYNKDGLPDIFTASLNPKCNTCIMAYQNISYYDGINHKYVPRFKKVADPLYFYDANGHRTEIDVSTASNPQFVDVDKDGHLDILGFDLNLISPRWYRNRGRGTDSLSFYYTKECWGYFTEVIQHLYQPWNCEVDSKGHKVWTGTYDSLYHSSGSHFYNSMCAFDVDGDGDIDLLMGDGLNDSLTFLENGRYSFGGPNYNKDTMINISTHHNQDSFPTDYPAVIPTMPTPSYLDVNHDSLNDLIVSAGQPTFRDTVVDRIHNIWYYENNGTKPANGKPGSNIFNITSKDFLQNTMLDWGINSAPCFIDVDKDGRKDLLIAVRDGSAPKANSHIVLYLNKAGKTSGSKPYLLYQTDDYLGFSKLATRILAPVPAAYYNAIDSTTDLLMGNDSGQVMYYKDRGGKKNPADFHLSTSSLKYLSKGKWIPIAVNANSAPTAADINGDGKMDILIGSANGTISYYRCQGFGPAPDYVPYFVLVTKTFGGLFSNSGFAYQTAPCVADLDRDGKPDLLVGDESGRLFYFHDFDTTHVLYDTAHVKAASYLVKVHDYGSGKDSTRLFSTYTIPAVAYLDQDSLPDIMLGCRRGGLIFLGSASNDLEVLHTAAVEVPKSYNPMAMAIYPNPAGNVVTLSYNNLSATQNSRLVVSDMLGRQIISHMFELENGKGNEQINTTGLANGIYIVNVESEGELLFSNKLIIAK